MNNCETKKIPDLLWFQEGPGVRNTQYTSSGVKLLNVANLVNGKVDLSTSDRYISEEEAYGKYKHFLVDDGDFIIASSGIKVDYFDKKMGFISASQLPLCMNTSTIRFKVIDKSILDIRYFMYYLKSDHFKRQLSYNITGSAQLNFGPSHIKKMTLPLVCLNEQLIIIERLDKTNDIIDKLNNLLILLDELITSRFVEMFGLIENPTQRFNRNILRNLCYKITDGKHGGCTQESGTKRYFVGAREIYDDIVHYETAPEITIEEFEKDYKRCNVEIGDLLIVNTGATIGKTAIAKDYRTKHTLLQKSVALLKVNQELIHPVFLKYCYKTNDKMYKVQSASAQPNLLLSKIKETEIFVPSICLQNQFADFVAKVEQQKATVQKSIDKLETLKKSLMQEYFG